MTTWNDRLLPHPLLAPWNDDYTDATFTAQVPHAVLNNGKQINLTIKYHLTSQALRALVEEGKARYVGLVLQRRICRGQRMRRCAWTCQPGPFPSLFGQIGTSGNCPISPCATKLSRSGALNRRCNTSPLRSRRIWDATKVAIWGPVFLRKCTSGQGFPSVLGRHDTRPRSGALNRRRRQYCQYYNDGVYLREGLFGRDRS